MSSPIDETVSRAVAAILEAARPEGVPDTISIRSSGDKTPVERPYLVAFCEDGESPHPRMRKSTLVLRLRTRADEQDSEAAAAWHQVCVDFLTVNPAALHATLQPLGIELLKFPPGAFTDAAEEERGREYDFRWPLVVRLVE